MKVFKFAGVVVLPTIAAVCGQAMAGFVPGAAMVDVSLAGNTQYDGWIGLTSANYAGYGAFPGTASWPTPIGSNRTLANGFNPTEAGDANLIKVSNGAGGMGGPHPGSAGIYFGGFSSTPNTFGGSLAVTDATPVGDLKNVVFQIQIGEAWTHDFFNGAMPTLSINGGSQQLAANATLLTDQFFNGTVQMPTGPEDVFINTYLLQWDLTGVGAISDFSIGFSGVQHAQVYGLRLDQSNIYTAVPGPGALALVGFAAVWRSRCRR